MSGNVLFDINDRDDRILTCCYATDDGCAEGNPHTFLNHDGLSDCGGASLRWFKRMALRVHVNLTRCATPH
jgi:hypothetical protein